MKTTDLQDTWKSVNQSLAYSSDHLLEGILKQKIARVIIKFDVSLAVAILICAGVLVFLILTAINRSADSLYLLNNGLLGVIVLGFFIYYQKKFYDIRAAKRAISLKSELQSRITALSGSMSASGSVFLIPVILILLITSIHVYFSSGTVGQLFQQEESVIGLIVGAIVGLIVSFMVSCQMRRHFRGELEKLSAYYQELISEV